MKKIKSKKWIKGFVTAMVASCVIYGIILIIVMKQYEQSLEQLIEILQNK